VEELHAFQCLAQRCVNDYLIGTALFTEVMVFWVVTTCSVVVEYLHPEDGGSMVLRNVGIQP